jgi:hypothetical protein
MPPNLVQQIVSRLNQFAGDCGIAGASQRYFLSGKQLLREDLAARAGIPGGVAVFLPFAAERITIKTNLRVFGLARLPRLTAKVMLISHGARPSVLRDVRGRRIAAEHLKGRIRVPTVRHYDRRGANWLLEDFIAGEIAAAADLGSFIGTYAQQFILPLARMRRIRGAPRVRPLVDVLEYSLRSLFPKIGTEAVWPVAYSHNDLNPDNLLKTADGGVQVLDWELSGVAPIAAELGQVYLRSPESRELILAILAAVDPERIGLPPHHQLALGASLALNRVVHANVHMAMHSRGLSEGDARKALEGMISDARRAIVRLAA